jgi:hypothetical protein
MPTNHKSTARISRSRRNARLTARFLVKEGTRYRWQPPRYPRELGLVPERLPDDPLEARRRAEALSERADTIRLQARRQARAGTKGTPAATADLNQFPIGSVSWLIRKYAGDISDPNAPGASPHFSQPVAGLSLGKEKTRILWRVRAGLLNTLFFAVVRQVEGIRRLWLVLAKPVRNAS